LGDMGVRKASGMKHHHAVKKWNYQTNILKNKAKFVNLFLKMLATFSTA